jgi:hypothetical protein
LQAGRSLYDNPALMPEALAEALSLWRHLQLLARTLGLEDKQVPDQHTIVVRLPDAMRQKMDGRDLFAEMARHADAVSALIERHIIEPSGLRGKALDKWEEGPVKDII